MHPCPIHLSLAYLSCAVCILNALPVLSPSARRDSGVVPGESRLVVPADQAEQLLERAAAALAQGQERDAAALLEQYLHHEPRHLFIRAQVAELLYRQQLWEQSRHHFQCCVGLAQEFGDAAYSYLIHAHSRLVDIAEVEQDAFTEHLHRGIGLFELAREKARRSNASASREVDSILGRAALSLHDARTYDPRSARLYWYLYKVWSHLGQHSAACQALVQADELKFFAELTPQEKRDLQLASLKEQLTLANKRVP